MTPATPQSPPCWFHRFGGGEPCQNAGDFWWPDPPDDYAAVVRAMRWCAMHRHASDVRVAAQDEGVQR